MRTVRIAGTGLYTPERSMPTEEVGAILGIDLTQQIEAGGIKLKKIMAEDEEASDMAVYAGMQALKNAGVKPSELDLIIVSTDTPDYISPCTAAIVQHRLLAKNAGVFDTNVACAGWVTALRTSVPRCVSWNGRKRRNSGLHEHGSPPGNPVSIRRP